MFHSKREYFIPLYLFLFQSVKWQFTVGSLDIRESGGADNFAEKQLQLLKLFNNLNCIRKEDKDLHEISTSFNPLKSLSLYKDPSLVQSFFEKVDQGLYLGKLEPFTNSAEPLKESIQLFDILYFNADWDLVYKTAAYASTRVNTAQFVWAISTLLTSDVKYKGLKSPPAYEIFPQLFTPKWILQKANGEDGSKDADDENPENVLKYFRHDPSINIFHMAWHVDFPFWWKPDKYGFSKGRKGELFLYMHHQIVNRYKAERLSNKMTETLSLDLDKPIKEGDIPVTLNINWEEFPLRAPNAIFQDTVEAKVSDLQTFAQRLSEGISQGFFIATSGEQVPLRNENGSDYLGAAMESSQESVNGKYYGSLHGGIHRTLAQISDPNNTLHQPPGIQSHSETALQDPVFYRIHRYVDDFNQAEKSKLTYYSRNDLLFPDVDISSVNINQPNVLRTKLLWPFPNIPVLKTFFEDFSYDISNGIKSCDRVNSGENFTATVKRLNHYPFEYTITAYSKKPTKGIVRIYMSPINGYDGKPFPNEELYWNMFEMDRFPVTLKQGQNTIKRLSKNSSVTILDRPGFKELIQEAKNEALSPSTDDLTRHCGFPHNLLLPKGTAEGMKFKMFVIITPGEYDEETYPLLSLCGNPRGIYPDGKAMGFPFDRKVSFGFSFPLLSRENYKFLDIVIKHVG